MEKNLVSIIVPVYNAEEYLDNIFNDILQQSYFYLEIIIIDDGSRDNSWSIIQKYTNQDARIQCIKTVNRGPSSARNIGLKVAKGEYIRFIDADDSIPKDSIRLMVEAMKMSSNVDLVIGNYQCVPDHNYFKGDELSDVVLSKKEFTKSFVRNVKSFYYGVTWNKLYKNEIICKNNIWFDEKIDWCEDLCFNIDYYEKTRNIHILSVNKGVYTYFSRENSVTNCLNSRKKQELKKIDDTCFCKAKEYFKPYGLDRLMQAEWKYSNLYYKLSELAGDNIIDRQNYYGFRDYLRQKEVQNYIEYKKKESTFWLFLRYVNKKNIHMIAYVLFIIKNILVKKMGRFLPNLKTYLQKKLPKSL